MAAGPPHRDQRRRGGAEPEHGGVPEHALGRSGQVVDAGGQDGLHTGGQQSLGQLAGEQPPLAVARQRTPVDEQVQQLGEEERVALGPGEQRGAHALVQLVGRRTEVGAQQPLQGDVLQRQQREQLHVGQAAPPPRPAAELEQFRSADAEHEDRSAGPARDVEQSRQGRRGRPVQVVEHEHQRTVLGEGGEQGRDGLADLVAAGGHARRRGPSRGGAHRAPLRLQPQQRPQRLPQGVRHGPGVRRVLQPGDGAGDPLAGGLGVVVLADAACRPDHLGDGRQVTSFAVRRAAPPQHARARQLADETRELLRQPGLADPGVPGHQHDPGPGLVGDLERPSEQQPQLGLAADDRGLVAQPEPARGGRAQADELVRRDRLPLALEPQRRQRPPRRDRLGRQGGPAAGEDRADAGGVREPGRGVHGVADDRVGQVGLDAGQHLAGVQAHPQAEPAPAPALLLDDPPDRGLHPGGGAHGPLGVVLVCGRGAEHGHQAVSGQLVDVAPVLDDRGRQGGQDPVGDDADALGVQVLRPARELRQVAEQHRHDASLGLVVGTGGVGQRRAAREAEAGGGDRRGAAGRAGHRRWASWARTDRRAAGHNDRSTSA